GGSTVLTPKVGLGYGLISQSQESISSEGINQSASTSITAPYGVVGAELSLTDSISVFADYAMSFGGKSSTKTTVAGIPGGETSLSARFDRIRFGGYVRVGKRVKVGGQYINR